MKISFLKGEFSICQLRDLSRLDLSGNILFLAKTPDELSLVCPTESVPDNTLKVDHGWAACYIEGELDFSLVGILAEISRILAENRISLFAASTYNTDYVLIKQVKVGAAREAFRQAGYDVA